LKTVIQGCDERKWFVSRFPKKVIHMGQYSFSLKTLYLILCIHANGQKEKKGKKRKGFIDQKLIYIHSKQT
jgi:hypothetical protein